MTHHLPALLLGLGLSTASIVPAAAYPVDCAILLCLAGGWPASAECAHARAVFIARITPWPIEPPLQIWNCPLRASLGRKHAPIERLFDIAFRAAEGGASWSTPGEVAGPLRVQNQADIDISGPAYDFVQSIRLFQIEYRRTRNREGDCLVTSSIREGRYDVQGAFNWTNAAPSQVPAASAFDPGANCMNYGFRSVFVDWTDALGSYGFEEVRY